MTLRQVSNKVDVDQSTMSKIERNELIASQRIIKPLSEELGVEYRELQIKFLSEKIYYELKHEDYPTESLETAKKWRNEVQKMHICRPKGKSPTRSKNFEIIGEAAYHLTDEIKGANPKVEWKKIMAFRHILVHDYYKINLEIVWKARENKIDGLRNQLIEILDQSE
ncbi:MAG: DUF86 domain-containing protein [Lewinellaceae bacterium]|nr:DUF86 domain-containing protein [Lewinellaceae bacterium]